MKRTWWRDLCVVVLVVAAGVLTSCSSSPRDPAAGSSPSPSPSPLALAPEMVARADIQARYEAMAQALKAKNVKGYMEPFTPDYTFTSEIGETDSRTTIESQMRDALSYTDTLTCSARIDDLRLEGDRAHLTVTETMTSTKVGRQTIEVAHVLHSQWTKGPTGWKLARAREKSVTMTVDGKPQGGQEPVSSSPATASPRSARPRS